MHATAIRQPESRWSRTPIESVGSTEVLLDRKRKKKEEERRKREMRSAEEE
jgi:hypothetical protein